MHLVTTGLVLTFLLGSFARGADSPVVATIGSKSISLEEFNRRYDEVKKRAVNPPPKKAFLEDLVRYEVGVQEAEKRNLEKDPIVAERLREELYKSLIEKDLSDKVNAIQVNDAEMKEYYKSNPDVRTSHILIDIKPNASPEERAQAKKRAEEIYAEVKASKKKSFEDLVKLYSDDIATKKNGGDVGWQTRVTVVPTYYEAALKLKPNELTGVVETPYGFHIIKMKGVRSYAESIKASPKLLREAVFEKKRLALFNEYFDKLKKRYKITENSEILK